ncbi:MAG TPA: RnfH family protein [Rudaea sp.]
MAETIFVEVAFAEPDHQVLRRIEVPAGSTALDAVRAAGLAERVAMPPLASNLGIFSRPVEPQTVLRDGDRVEIYRPLKADPKESRRRRAQAQR